MKSTTCVLIGAVCGALLAPMAIASGPYLYEPPPMRCPAAMDVPPERCLVLVENPGFERETIAPWQANAGSVERFAPDDAMGSAKLVMRQPGDLIRQYVWLPARLDPGPPLYYLPAVYARAEGGAEARFRVVVSTLGSADGPRQVFAAEYTAGEAWNRYSGGFDGPAGETESIVEIVIERIDGDEGATLQLEDVELIQHA